MKRRYMVVGFVLIALLGVGYLAWQLRTGEWSPGVTINDTPAMVESARLIAADDENPSPTYRVTFLDGEIQRMTPERYALLLLQKDDSRAFTFKLLNISTPVGIAWVVLGLLGQVLFTGRMIVQWLVSEKEKQSIVPPAFWWMSLFGASMLIAYFIWRKDIVGFLGQGTGWLIYGRNLWLIYHPRKSEES
jgi:lipid-A-disaccharide synthase-like uncharacterized protein